MLSRESLAAFFSLPTYTIYLQIHRRSIRYRFRNAVVSSCIWTAVCRRRTVFGVFPLEQGKKVGCCRRRRIRDVEEGKGKEKEKGEKKEEMKVTPPCRHHTHDQTHDQNLPQHPYPRRHRPNLITALAATLIFILLIQLYNYNYDYNYKPISPLSPPLHLPSLFADQKTERCRRLRLLAEPCVDECRKRFLEREAFGVTRAFAVCRRVCLGVWEGGRVYERDRKSTRLNSSHWE